MLDGIKLQSITIMDRYRALQALATFQQLEQLSLIWEHYVAQGTSVPIEVKI